MSFLKRFERNSAPQPPDANQPGPKTPALSSNKVTLSAILLAIAMAVLCVHFGSPVLAKTGQQPEAKPEAKAAASDIDPDAIDAVKKMAAYLHTLKSYQIIDDVTQDDVLEDGLVVQST